MRGPALACLAAERVVEHERGAARFAALLEVATELRGERLRRVEHAARERPELVRLRPGMREIEPPRRLRATFAELAPHGDDGRRELVEPCQGGADLHRVPREDERGERLAERLRDRRRVRAEHRLVDLVDRLGLVDEERPGDARLEELVDPAHQRVAVKPRRHLRELLVDAPRRDLAEGVRRIAVRELRERADEDLVRARDPRVQHEQVEDHPCTVPRAALSASAETMPASASASSARRGATSAPRAPAARVARST